jgi:hypothetical protein
MATAVRTKSASGRQRSVNRNTTVLPKPVGKQRGGVETQRRSVISGLGEPVNLARADLDAGKIQAALAQAERGDTRNLFQLYRDSIASYSHVQTEMQKRKLALISKPCEISPKDKDDPADVQAADAIRQMIEASDEWNRGLMMLMDAIVYPVMVGEKIFKPYDPQPSDKVVLRYGSLDISKVDPFLYNFRLPYLPLNRNNAFSIAAPVLGGYRPIAQGDSNENRWNPDRWEPDLNFYYTDTNGMVIYNPFDTYAPDPDINVVYRANTLTSQRDNWGGPMRAVLLWWFCATKGRDWWARFMERFGVPFTKIIADMNDVNIRNLVNAALQELTKVFGLALPEGSDCELVQAMTGEHSKSWESWLDFCHRQISNVIVGQTLSAKADPTGLGSGVASFQSDVSESVRAFDEITLGECCRKQVFRQFLRVNGLSGAVPNITWGGMSEQDKLTEADGLGKLYAAGIQVAPESLDTLSDRWGIRLEMKPEPEPVMAGAPGGGQFGKGAAK